MKNKKSQAVSSLLMIYFAMFIFSVISIIAVIMTYTEYAIGNDYVLIPMYNISEQLNNSARIENASAQIVTNYQGMDLDFIDNMWFFSYFILLISSFGIAYKTKSVNYFSFLSMLTYGLMIVLFIASLFSAVLNILYYDILQNLFINMAVSVPKLAYFVRNFGYITLLHSASLLLIMMLDFDFAFIRNRQKKEEQAFDDEII